MDIPRPEEVIKEFARRYFPVNAETRITIISLVPEWRVPIYEPLHSVFYKDAIPNHPSISTETIKLTHMMRFDESYYRFSYGSISNTLIICKEKSNIYDKEEFDNAFLV